MQAGMRGEYESKEHAMRAALCAHLRLEVLRLQAAEGDAVRRVGGDRARQLRALLEVARDAHERHAQARVAAQHLCITRVLCLSRWNRLLAKRLNAMR